MPSVSLCPKCGEQVAIPSGLDTTQTVRCPHCLGEYTLEAALEIAPPELIIVEHEDDFDGDSHVLSSSEREQSTRPGDAEVEPETVEIDGPIIYGIDNTEDTRINPPLDEERGSQQMAETFSLAEPDSPEHHDEASAEREQDAGDQDGGESDIADESDASDIADQESDEILEFPAEKLPLDTAAASSGFENVESNAPDEPSDLSFDSQPAGFDASASAEEVQFEPAEFPSDELAEEPSDERPLPVSEAAEETAPILRDLDEAPENVSEEETIEFNQAAYPSGETEPAGSNDEETIEFDLPATEAQETTEPVLDFDAEPTEFAEVGAESSESFDAEQSDFGSESSEAGMTTDSASFETDVEEDAAEPKRRMTARMVMVGAATVCLAVLCLVFVSLTGWSFFAKKPMLASLLPKATSTQTSAEPKGEVPTPQPEPSASATAPERPTMPPPVETPAPGSAQKPADSKAGSESAPQPSSAIAPTTTQGQTAETNAGKEKPKSTTDSKSPAPNATLPTQAAPPTVPSTAPAEKPSSDQRPTLPAGPAEQPSDTTGGRATGTDDQATSIPPAGQKPESNTAESLKPPATADESGPQKRTAHRITEGYSVPPMEGADLLDGSSPTTTKPSEEAMAAGATEIGPRLAITYTANDVDQALANFENVNEQITAAAKDREALKKLRTPYFLALYQLAEIVTFSNSASSKLAEQKERVEATIRQFAADQTRVTDMGRAAAKWLSLTSARRGAQNGGFLFQNGICLGGKVQNVDRRGAVFETRIVLAGGGPIVAVLSAAEPKLHSGTNVVVLGSIVENAADQVAGYEGGQQRVVWTGLLVAAPAK